MKLLSIELYLYKPFLHHKTKHVTIPEVSHVTVISGENACGKSSLLRACTPYPAVSTEFEKGGYKKIVYAHMGSIFELSSDFRKTAGAHSFIKDGIELNESGTTEVQNNLVMEYFGYDDVVEKLVTGKYKICDMGKPDRKTLFMSTYPSSMAFILDHYKLVSAKLRATNNNIKMLTQRKISLEQQILSPPILSDYRKEKEELTKACSTLDLDIYTVNKAIKYGKEQLEQIDPTIRSYTSSYFQEACYKIVRRFKELMSQYESMHSIDDFASIYAEIREKSRNLKDQINTNETTAIGIRNEINKFKTCISTDSESAIQDCKRKLELQETIIKNTKVSNEIPWLDKDDYQQLAENYDSLLETISNLRLQEATYWSEEHFNKVMNKDKILVARCQSLEEEINNMKKDLEPLEIRLEKYKKRSWPANCTTPCGLRNEFSSIVANCESQINTLKDRLQKRIQEYETLTNEEKNYAKALLDRVQYADDLWQLEKYLTSHHWGNWVLNNEDFYQVINRNINDIYNRITMIYTNAGNVLKVKEAQEKKTLLEAQLLSLTTGSQQTKQVIIDSIREKETQLLGLITTVTILKERLSELEKTKHDVQLYQDIKEDCENVQEVFYTWKKAFILNAEIEHFQKYIDSLLDSKTKINEKLRELEQIIKEQDNYLIRLNDEVEPELKKLTQEQKELSAIETQLSPTKGISHLYIIRYINSIFKLANQFIARVWSYPMQLEYIDENDESFDYSFRLLINESSSIKDINIASAGQKSIINLCVMLAICIFRHYGSDYPIILDEVTVNMSLNHQNSLITFLNELFADEGLKQIFIVDHCIDVCSSFASIAEMICLSRDFDIGQEWKRIGTIE